MTNASIPNLGCRSKFGVFIIGLVVGFLLGVFVAASGVITWNTKKGDFGFFVGEPESRMLNDGETLQLTKDFVYIDPYSKPWVAKSGSVTNGASIPRLFWTIVGSPLTGKYRYSAIIHDAACEEMQESWEDVHLAFYWGCRSQGIPEPQANMLYAAVYHFGPRWETEFFTEVREINLADGSVETVPVSRRMSTPILRDPVVDENKAIEFIKKMAQQNLSLDEIQQQEFTNLD